MPGHQRALVTALVLALVAVVVLVKIAVVLLVRGGSLGFGSAGLGRRGSAVACPAQVS
jgi:hypothetical protein